MSNVTVISIATLCCCIVLLMVCFAIACGIIYTQGMGILGLTAASSIGSSGLDPDSWADKILTTAALFAAAGYVLGFVLGNEHNVDFRRRFRRRGGVRGHRHNNDRSRGGIIAEAVFLGILLVFANIYHACKMYIEKGRDMAQEYILDVRDIN